VQNKQNTIRSWLRLRPGLFYKNQVLGVERETERQREGERALYVLKVADSQERDRSDREDRFCFRNCFLLFFVFQFILRYLCHQYNCTMLEAGKRVSRLYRRISLACTIFEFSFICYFVLGCSLLEFSNWDMILRNMIT
jgi:hypothetical protein